jgi:FkbM family methyltransferase
MSIFLLWFKKLAKRSKILMRVNAGIRWKLHVLTDWWGTMVWTKTKEVLTPLGFKLTSGLHPAYELMRSGGFEIEETTIISRLLPRVDVFVDIGANLGYYTCLALQSGKSVIAFEPQQQNLYCLFQNLIANGWENKAEVFPLALSENPGLLTLYGASGPSASLIKNWAGYSSRFKKTVPVSTLDKVLAGRVLGRRLFIKIDVEGAEYQVMKGALMMLELSPRPIWLLEICLEEFHPDGYNPNFLKIFELFWSYGYQAYTATINPMLITPGDVAKWIEDGHANPGKFNYVFAESDTQLHA